MRGNLLTVVLATGGLLGLGIGAAPVRGEVQASATDPTAGFVGADGCKDCHAAIFAAWSDTKHAKALGKLWTSDRQGGQCIRCHVTGTPERIAAEGSSPSFPNVQCEACHGAGQAHVEAAKSGKAATVRTPAVTEATCTACHNDTSPHYKPFFFRALKGLVHKVD